jgi:two-component system, cell cycle response regulator DivK
MDATRPGARILIVDDRNDQIEMYRFALEHAGFVVDDANEGHEAIVRARATAPDILILDVWLRDMSGWDVCQTLKADPGTAKIPIVILTAAASPTFAQQAEESGCAAYLLKPCYPDDLVRTVRQVLAAV